MIFPNNVLDTKILKWIADIAIYNVLGNESTYSKIVEIPLNEVNDTIEEFYRIRLDGIINYEQFLKEFHELKTLYGIHGEVYIWSRFAYIRFYCHNRLKTTHHLFGDNLEIATDEKVMVLTNKISVSQWDANEYPDIRRLVNKAYNFHDTSQRVKAFSNEAEVSDIKVNNDDGKEFSVNITDIITNPSMYTERFHDSEYYAETMSNIYTASTILFSDDSNGKSNLYELYYSIINYLGHIEMQKIISDAKEEFPNIEYDVRMPNPVKFLYSKYGYPKWGHKLYTEPDYMTIQPGNETRINEIVNNGVKILDNLFRIMSSNKLIKSNISIYFGQVCSQLIDSFTIEDTDIISNAAIERKLTPANIWHIVKGVHSASQVKMMLECCGKSISAFPCDELRQGTWKRLSNYYELTKYHHVHDGLDNIITLDYGYNFGLNNVSRESLIIQKPKQITEFQILEDAKKLNLNLKFKRKAAINKKFKINSSKDENVYTKIITNLSVLCKRTITLRFLDENISLNSLINILVDIIELSLCFISYTPDVYTLRNSKILSKLKTPDIKEIQKYLQRILSNGTNISEDIFNSKDFCRTVMNNASYPERIINIIYDTHDSINSYLVEELQDCEIEGITQIQGNPPLDNLNFFMNILILKELKHAIADALYRVMKLAGINHKGESTSEMTPLLDGVVSLTKNSNLINIIRYQDMDEYVRCLILQLLIDKFGISGSHVKMYLNSFKNINGDAIYLHDQLYTELLSYFDYNTQINLSDSKIDLFNKVPFEQDLQVLSMNFQKRMLGDFNLETFQSNNYEYLALYNINPSCYVLGVDGNPIMRKVENEKTYWVYSSLKLKTKYPGTNNKVEPMTQEDINFVLQQIEGV